MTMEMSLPTTPWLHLQDVEDFLVRAKLIPLVEIEIDGRVIYDSQGFVEISKWITACGFHGVGFLGRPVVEGTDNFIGSLQEIPVTYFRKERGSYGDTGISRLSMNQTREEQDAAARDDAAGYGECGWQEVLINREQLINYIHRNGWKIERRSTGAPGRPTSMQLVEAEFSKRAKEKIVLPTITQESEYLASWVASRFPLEPRLTPKTIKNKLALPYRQLSA